MTYGITLTAGIENTEYNFVVDTPTQVKELVDNSLMVKSVRVTKETGTEVVELNESEVAELLA